MRQHELDLITVAVHSKKPEIKPVTRFIRTSWLLSSVQKLQISGQPSSSVRQISEAECLNLVDQVRKRNVFARHSWENNFYLKRVGQLSKATVIEIYEPGEIGSALPSARWKADVIEKTAFISSILGIRRQRLRQLLAINPHRKYGFDLAIAPAFRYVRTSERPQAEPRGVKIDAAFARRFDRCGFAALIAAILSESEIGRRLEQGMNWLSESRHESSSHAAVVKTAIALESLLIASDRESLRSPLSERAAFLLSDDPARRRRIAKAVKFFYDLRSAIVHGGKRRPSASALAVLDGIDRIVVLLLLTMAANSSTWTSMDIVVGATEDRKWGVPAVNFSRPFPESHLTRAIKLSDHKSPGGG